MRRAWLGLGGNIGDVRASMIAALRRLDLNDGISVRRLSGLYETPPWGMTDQPAFLNACAEIGTTLEPRALLEACLSAERSLHRVRGKRWGPRTIDLDILAMDRVAIREDGLVIPHPRLPERAFALLPLRDLAPDLEVAGHTVADWLSRCDTGEIRPIAGPCPWGDAVWNE